MGHLIDFINSESGKINVHLADGGHIQALDQSHVDSIVELYRTVYDKLKEEHNEKFIHPVAKEEVEELLASEDSAIVGYFKDKKHLVGVAYTKPSTPDSKYFRTPKYDEGKTAYIFGGLAVNPEFRGKGINPRIVSTMIKGLKHYSAAYPNLHIGGAGFEISCENFLNLRSVASIKQDDGTPTFNVVGIHYLETPEEGDNDLTILGYKSFDTPVEDTEVPFDVALDGIQANSFETMVDSLHKIGECGDGLSTVSTEGHNIVTLNNNFYTPMAEMQLG